MVLGPVLWPARLGRLGLCFGPCSISIFFFVFLAETSWNRNQHMLIWVRQINGNKKTKWRESEVFSSSTIQHSPLVFVWRNQAVRLVCSLRRRRFLVCVLKTSQPTIILFHRNKNGIDFDWVLIFISQMFIFPKGKFVFFWNNVLSSLTQSHKIIGKCCWFSKWGTTYEQH